MSTKAQTSLEELYRTNNNQLEKNKQKQLEEAYVNQELMSKYLDKNMNEKFKPYATRIQSFLYKVIALLPKEKLVKALSAACNSIIRFNERTGSNENLMNKYLNYRLLEAVVKSKDTKVPQLMKPAYQRMTEFKNKNEKFSHLF